MTHQRPYSKAVTKEEALTKLKRCSGSQFDPDLTISFLKIMEDDNSS